ncbi:MULTISPECIES: hypothetical protein [unclassified Mycobacterium]|uniref:hypothetical protein n=1 Tax=unclassified Mycobacterium TaxID=2642494 RepID=UPI0029C8FAA8|nr:MULTISPECIES: hypothetical protein [unclassified Mycobacterium]
MQPFNRRNVKMMAAVLGGGAAVTAGALSAALLPQQGANVAKYNVVNAGSTSTFSTPPSAPATGMAIPSIKGPAPLWAGEAPDSNPQ